MAACPEAGQLGALTPLRPAGDTHMARASCVFGCRFFGLSTWMLFRHLMQMPSSSL